MSARSCKRQAIVKLVRRSSQVNRLRDLVLCVLVSICVPLGSALLPPADAEGSHEAGVPELRATGRFQEALDLARELDGALAREGRRKDFERLRSRNLIVTLETIVALPEGAREEIAAAHQLDPQIQQERDQSNYGAAIALTKQQLASYRKHLGNESEEVALTLMLLGELEIATGDRLTPEASLREALAIVRIVLHESDPMIAKALAHLGELLCYQSRHPEAQPLYEEALAICLPQLGDDELTSWVLHDLGEVFNHLGEKDSAEVYYRRSLEMDRRTLSPDHPYIALTINQIANVRSAQGDFAGADSLFRRSVEMSVARLGEEHPRVALTLANRATNLRRMGSFAEAEALYQKALRPFEEPGMRSHADHAAIRMQMGLLSRRTGNLSVAIERLHEAAELFEQARLRRPAGISRAAFWERSPYWYLAHCHLSLDQTNEAWESIERDHGRGLADLLLAAGARELTPCERDRQDTLRTQLREAERENSHGANGSAGARARLARAEADWAQFQLEIAREHPVTEGRVFSLERIQRAIDPNAAIIGWLDSSTTGPSGISPTWTYVIRGHGPVEWFPYEWTQTELDTHRLAGEKLSHLLSRTTDDALAAAQISETGAVLFTSRVAPAHEALEDINHLIVIPSGRMAGVPIEAIPTPDGSYLGDEFTISYSPSATIYTWLSERSRIQQDEPTLCLAVGDPPFNPGQLVDMRREESGTRKPFQAILEPTGPFRSSGKDRSARMSTLLGGALDGNPTALSDLHRLPWTRIEVDAIGRLFRGGATLLTGESASEQELARLAMAGQLESFDFIHIATHAFPDDKRPGRSALILSQIPPSSHEPNGELLPDGLVTANEISRDWIIDAEVVTLSGCQTGLGRKQNGEGYIGFSQALLRAGARSVIVSLWRVEDQSTSMLMERFYAELLSDSPANASPMKKAAALAKAKHWLRNRTSDTGEYPYSDPYYWAGFVIIGDAS